MSPQEAIQRAKQYILHIFQDEGVSHIGLEEIRFLPETATWAVTIGFARSWENPEPKTLGSLMSDRPRHRVFKVVEIKDSDGSMVSVRDRKLINDPAAF